MKSDLIFDTIYGLHFLSHSVCLHLAINSIVVFIGSGGVRHSCAGLRSPT